MSPEPEIVQVGADHHSAPFSVLERLHRCSISGDAEKAARASCDGVVALVTCHRHEIYLEGVAAARAQEIFARWLGFPEADLPEILPHLRVRTGAAAARHLMRVVAGLESAVLGEDQVLAQAREAYRRACQAGSAGPLLHRLFHAAFRVGRRVRGETGLCTGVRSLAGAGIAHLEETLHGVEGRSFAVLGAGEMASLAARRLRERGAGRLVIASRTRERAEALAAGVDGETCEWAWRHGALWQADGAVCAVSSERPVVEIDWLREWVGRHGAGVAIVDLGVPANVERSDEMPAGLVLVDMAALSSELREADDLRQAAIAEAGAIVEDELSELLRWLHMRHEYREAARCVRGAPVVSRP